MKDAQEAGVALRGLGIDLALVSSATRTRETFAALGLDVPAQFLDELYFGGTETLLSIIGKTGDDVESLLVVGHAPTIPGLVAELAQASDEQAAIEAEGWYPTATFTSFTLDGPWADLASHDFGEVRFERIARPE